MDQANVRDEKKWKLCDECKTWFPRDRESESNWKRKTMCGRTCIDNRSGRYAKERRAEKRSASYTGNHEDPTAHRIINQFLYPDLAMGLARVR